MPSQVDRHGRILRTGDMILVPCKIVSIAETESYANLTAETIEPMFPTANHTHLSLNTRQVELIEVEAEGVPEVAADIAAEAESELPPAPLEPSPVAPCDPAKGDANLCQREGGQASPPPLPAAPPLPAPPSARVPLERDPDYVD